LSRFGLLGSLLDDQVLLERLHVLDQAVELVDAILREISRPSQPWV
jgi:hypothetical protein